MLVHAESGGLLSERLAAELADVEARFANELCSDLECVNELVGHVERYRGKMLRPTLVLVTAMAAEPERPRTAEAHRVLATVVEMVHMATLVHDDILDDARLRRRGTTINHLAGNEAAVMLGDYLISHAYHLCSSVGDEGISRLIAQATNTVCEGELLQLANRNNRQLNERVYFEIIRRKTASLCGTCCRAAAMVSSADDAVGDALHLYGEKLGLAFQIVDDLLDLTGDEQTVGKTLGRDLEKGKLTLPVIHALAHADSPQRAELKELLTAFGHGAADEADADASPEAEASSNGGGVERPGADDAVAVSEQKVVCRGDVQRMRSLLERVGSVEYAQDWARRLVELAQAAVTEHLPDSPARALMVEMGEAVLHRRF